LKFRKYPGTIRDADDFEKFNEWTNKEVKRQVGAFQAWLSHSITSHRDELLETLPGEVIKVAEYLQ